jgi:hypothetical protein
MAVSTFAFIIGAFYLFAGTLGFFPLFLSPPLSTDPSLTVHLHYGYLFGLFPVNFLHNIVHVMIGVAGLLAWRGLFPTREYCQFLGGFYGLLTVSAFLPGGDTMMGFIPIFRHDIWLHAVSAALGAYYGWFYKLDRDGARRRAQAA